MYFYLFFNISVYYVNLEINLSHITDYLQMLKKPIRNKKSV